MENCRTPIKECDAESIYDDCDKVNKKKKKPPNFSNYSLILPDNLAILSTNCRNLKHSDLNWRFFFQGKNRASRPRPAGDSSTAAILPKRRESKIFRILSARAHVRHGGAHNVEVLPVRDPVPARGALEHPHRAAPRVQQGVDRAGQEILALKRVCG